MIIPVKKSWIVIVTLLLSLFLNGCGGNSGGSGEEENNTPPTAEITNPLSGTVFAQDTEITFTGSASDSEDGSLTGSSLVWSSNIDGNIGSGTTVSKALATGNHTITLKASDSEGDTSTDSVKITVNAKPVFSTLSISSTEVFAGSSSVFTWSIADADGDVLTCGLDIDGDGSDEYTIQDCANTTSQTVVYEQTGEYMASLSVSDGINSAEKQELSIKVSDQPQSSPEIVSFTASPNSLLEGSSTTFEWSVRDVDSDTLTCGLDVNGNGIDDYTIQDCANNTSQSVVYTTAGNFTATLSVNDGINTPVKQELSVIVNKVSQASPEISSFTASLSSLVKGNSTTFEWSVSDADGNMLMCELDVDGDSISDYSINDCANTTSQTHTYASEGDYVASMRVSDGNSTVSSSVNISVINTSPAINSFEASSDQIEAGESTIFSWSVSDEDGDNLTCGLDVDGDSIDDYTVDNCANTTSQVYTYATDGNYTATLSVTDGVNTVIEKQLSIGVSAVNQSSPEIGAFTVSPDALPTGASTTFEWSVSDPENDLLTCELDVDSDGTVDYTISDCANNASQEHTFLSAGNYTAMLSVTDGNATVQGTIKDIRVSTAPSISLFEAAPVQSYTSTVTTFRWQVDDTDGDILTCSLDVDNDGVSEYTIGDCNATTLQEHSYEKSGDYQVKLSVSDGVSTVEKIISITVEPHLLLNVTADEPAVAGGRVLYTMTVSNIGQSYLSDVQANLTVPAELSFYYSTDAVPNASSCGGNTCSSGEEATWNLGTLAAGESRTITVNALVLADTAAGTLIDVPIRVTSSDMIDVINLVKTVKVNNDPEAELAISASKDPVMPGESFVYTFDIGNIDTSALANLELRAALPTGVSVQNIGGDGTVDTATGEVVWDIASLAVGNAIRREVEVTVDSAAIAGQILSSRAELRFDGGVALDASAEYAVTVVDETQPLTVDISATPDPVAAGERLLYTMTVSNTAAVPVDDVDVLLRVAPELSFYYSTDAVPDSFRCGDNTCSSGEEAYWDLGTLAAGESRTITVNALVLADTAAGTLIDVPIRVTSSDMIDVINRIQVTVTKE